MGINLITGAGGMVGSHLAEYFYERKQPAVGIYYNPTIDIKEIKEKIQLIECDIRYPDNIEAIIKKLKPDTIYHLAAQSYPTVSWEKPYETMEINIGGTVAVFEAIKKVREEEPDYDPVVTVACSSAEYGSSLEEAGSIKIGEEAALKPLHPYGVSKVGQDLLAYQYWMNDHIKTIRARIFNTTGTRKVNDVVSDLTRRAVELKLNGSGLELRVGNIETKRAIMDVGDLIQALVLLTEKGSPGEVYNISAERMYQISDLIGIIERRMKVQYKLTVDPALLRTTDEKVIIGDVRKLKRDTGWEQKIDLEITIAEMLDYWRAVLQR